MWVPLFVFILSFQFHVYLMQITNICMYIYRMARIKEMNSLNLDIHHDSISTSITSEEITVYKVERPQVHSVLIDVLFLKKLHKIWFHNTGSSYLMRISLLRFFKTITKIWLMQFYGLFICQCVHKMKILLMRFLANAVFFQVPKVA